MTVFDGFCALHKLNDNNLMVGFGTSGLGEFLKVLQLKEIAFYTVIKEM